MEVVSMSECKLCEKETESLYELNHSEKGDIMVCRDCWGSVKKDKGFTPKGGSGKRSCCG